MSAVLAIAGNSFVGRGVCAELARQGVRFVATARRGDVDARCDLLNAAEVDSVVRHYRPAGVVQCAGVVDARAADEFYRAHVQGTLHLLEAVRKHVPEATVVLLGSAAEYGPVEAEDLPIGEAHPARPTTFYGASKLAQTQLGVVAASAWGLKVRTARLFNVIGPGTPQRYFVASVVRRLQSHPRGVPFALSNPQATRDFVDVRDAAAAIVRLLASNIPSDVYNVASGCETALCDVVAYLGELAGGVSLVEAEPEAGRVNVSRSRGDSSLIRALGWAPQFHWRQSVADCWAASLTQAARPSAA